MTLGANNSEKTSIRVINGHLNNILCMLFCIVLAIHVVGTIILASVPPISRDALIHHLAVPKMYLEHGGIHELPSMHFSYFPMNLDLLYMVPLFFKVDIAAKYIHFSFALMTAGLLYSYLKCVLNRTYGMLGALLFLTIPVIVKLSITVYVDLGLIFFSWACLYYYIKWDATHFKKRYLFVSGLFCGLALGTKYNGLILLIIMAVVISIFFSMKKNHQLSRKNSERYRNSCQGLMWAIGFVLIALTVFSPWMIRNTIWKGNPLYPLFKNVFNPPQRIVKIDLPKEKKLPHNAFWIRRNIYHESFIQTLSIPIRAFFQGQDDNPKYFDGKLNPFLLFFALVAFLPFKDNRSEVVVRHRYIFLFFSLLFILFVFFRVDFRIRYMAPAIPPLVCLTVFGIRNLIQTISPSRKVVRGTGWLLATGAIVMMFAYNADYFYDQFKYVQPFDYLTGKVDRDTYIGRYRKEYSAIKKANQILPKNARVLCLSIGDRIYYLNRSAHLAEDFYKKTNGKFTEETLLEKLNRYQTTHVLIDKDVFFNWMQYQPIEVRTIFANVLHNYTMPLFEIDGIRLLEIRPRDI